MASFTKGGDGPDPFGSNEYLRSTQDVKKESYTVAASTVALETVNGVADQKILKPGEVMAKITSGPEAGKVGPFQAAATDGRQTAANIVGLNDTFLPWQLLERDVEIAVTYEATAVQGWCTERDAAGARVTLTNTTADAMRGTKGLDVMFK
ncbi:MAG: scaffolding protein [Phage AS32]|nr:MAG: scaffolding protein [Phage AS32]